MSDDDLDALFAAARDAAPQPSAALMARILADAAAEQPRLRARPVRVRSGLRALIAALGGAGGLAGLATAAVAGLWIGLAPPAAVDDLAATLWAPGEGETVDLIPDLEGMIDDAEG